MSKRANEPDMDHVENQKDISSTGLNDIEGPDHVDSTAEITEQYDADEIGAPERPETEQIVEEEDLSAYADRIHENEGQLNLLLEQLDGEAEPETIGTLNQQIEDIAIISADKLSLAKLSPVHCR